ncbi:MAG: phytoene/squalene synthase family protein [Mangrovicoccus sp.]
MSLEACADLVQRGDPDRWLSVLAAPVEARAKLLPIYAFNIEVARAPWVTGEPLIAEMRLQWWRDALDEIAQGGTIRRHEVVTPLSEVLTPTMALALDKLVEARRWDVYREKFESRAELETYLSETSGTLLWVSALALGASLSETVKTPIYQAGYAMGLANFLRAIPQLGRTKFGPLPETSDADLSDLAQSGLKALRQARQARSQIGRKARPAMLACWLAAPTLSRAKAHPTLIPSGRLELAEARRRGSLIWRRDVIGW